MEMVLDRTAGHCGDGAVCIHWRRGGDEPVELAAAAPFRLATAYVLASTWSAGAVPHPVRRTGRPWRTSLPSGPSVRTRLQEDEPAGAGEISPSHGGGLRARSREWREDGYAVGYARKELRVSAALPK